APARERFELTQPTDQAAAAAPAPASAWPSGAGGPGSGTHQIDADLLHSALCRAAPAGTTAALHEDKFVLLRSGDQLSIAERSGRTLIAGAIGADPNLMHRVARTSGIPVMARHWLHADQRTKAIRLVDRPWRTWTLRIPRRDSTMRSVRIRSRADLEDAWGKIPASTRARLIETPTGPACVLLMQGPDLLAVQLQVPLTVTGDGRAPLAELLDRELSMRAANPVLSQYRTALATNSFLDGDDEHA